VVFDDLNFENRGSPVTMKSPEQGAATSVLLATSPLVEGADRLWELSLKLIA
jgi:hypothetical protein